MKKILAFQFWLHEFLSNKDEKKNGTYEKYLRLFAIDFLDTRIPKK